MSLGYLKKPGEAGLLPARGTGPGHWGDGLASAPWIFPLSPPSLHPFATPLEFLPQLHPGPGRKLPRRPGPAHLDQARRPAGPVPRRQQDAQARVPGGRRAGAGRRHAGHLRRAAVQPLPHHAGGRGQGRPEVPLRDRGARARTATGRGQRQQLHVPPAGRGSDHRRSRWQRHGRGDAEVAEEVARRAQGLHHSRRRLQRPWRPGLRGLRAGVAAPAVRAGRGDRPPGGRLGQSGTHGGLVAGFLGTTSASPSPASASAATCRPAAAGAEGGAGGAGPAGRGR